MKQYRDDNSWCSQGFGFLDHQQRTRTQAEGQHGQLEYSIACTYGHSKIENDFVAEDVCGSVLNGSAALQLMGSCFGISQTVISKQSFEGSFISQTLLTSSRSSCQNITIAPLNIPANNSEVANQTRCNMLLLDVRSMSWKSHLDVLSSLFFFSFRISAKAFLAIQRPISFRSPLLRKTAIKITMRTLKREGIKTIRLYCHSSIPSAQLV